MIACALAPLFAAACSLVLDFDDVNGLPCGTSCDENHVCLVPKDTCVPRGSVERFKSCDLGADRPDDLCAQGEICESVNGLGKRCLPTCTVSNYATPEAAAQISFECPASTTCWESPRGAGVCSEGICTRLRMDCPAGQQCVEFNGAGVCFTTCKIFQNDPAPCAGDQVCQPIGTTETTACIQAGQASLGEICSDRDMCRQKDQFNRPLVCDRPAGSNDQRRCHAICECLGGGCDNTLCNSFGACAIARANVDPERGVGLGVCDE